jgi:hypothetical protein
MALLALIWIVGVFAGIFLIDLSTAGCDLAETVAPALLGMAWLIII